MKAKVLLLLCAVALMNGAIAQRICGTTEAEQYIRSTDEKYDLKRQQIENFTHEFIVHGGGIDRALVTIPVVVHVVWNTTAENISDAQVLSQIEVLNKDFRKLNSDASSVPSAFAGLAADVNIEFCLATVDPSGNPTTGITRKQTSVTAFGTNDQVKSTSTGGVNAWNRDKYLNIWVCDISGGILGYAQFPGGSAGTDGVVIDYQYFGTVGTATAPFNKGRTATHEVGHWLNLYHIWGDDGTGCSGSDQVSDTPNAGGPNYGCPSFPKVSCSNGPNGDLFMNYMDYTDDACMYMFTGGQAARMQALFASGGFRAPLLTSNGCGSAGTVCATPSGLSTGSITASSAAFSWSPVSGATAYNLRYKLTSSSAWTSVNGLTSTGYNISGLTSCSAYEWQVQSVCGGSTTSSFSSSATYSTTGCVATYCASTGLSTADEYINRVVIGSINNTSGNNNGYANFTSISTNLTRGTSVSFNGTPGFTGSSYNETWRVWIDYNQDLDFNDAGELVYTSSNTSAAVTGSFTVPTTAALGATRMRVSMKYNSAASPCESFQYGEVEDYTVNIIAAASCGTPAGLAVSSVTQSGATASWSSVSGATSYSFQYKTNAASTWTTISVSGTSTTLSGLSASTTYNTRVAAVCSGTTGSYSSQVNFTTTAAPSCGTPAGLAVSSVTQSGATASWSSVSGATSYSFQYKTNAASTWTTISVSGTSTTLSGLSASTTYNTRVAAVCSGTTGSYSSQVNFTTPAAPSACTDNYETNNTSAQAKTISVNTNITARISSTSDKDWFKFNNTSANRNIRIDLTTLPADYDVRLYNPSGTQVAISQNGSTSSEVITYNNGPVGTYRVQVYGYNGANSTSCYTLRASISGTSFREGDVYEAEAEELVIQEEPIASVNVFPNPTSNHVDITFSAKAEGEVHIQVADMTGRIVYATAMPVVAGFNKTTVEMAEFAPGFYTVLLNNGEKTVSTKVMKQ